jgi:imidazolonepropionase-like amidohydrolase
MDPGPGPCALRPPRRPQRPLAVGWFVAACLAWIPAAQASQGPAEPGAPGVAIRASKALLCPLAGEQVLDDALVLVQGGRIEAVGRHGELAVPEGYGLLDVRPNWIMPGMIDLHSHVAGDGINDMIFQTNPGLRASATVQPHNPRLRLALAAGVTTILYIPGSGTNIGGQGVLLKTSPGTYESVLVRDPGALKVAQGDNPKRRLYGMERGLMNYHIRHVLTQGKAYARRWQAHEDGAGPAPERALHLDIFRDLEARRTQIATHTQYYQVVLASLRILTLELGFDAFIDHGSFDSMKLASLAEEIGVAAILGPREVLWPRPPAFDTDGQVQGTAWGFQRGGHTRIGFNTDAPVVPQEELPLQAAMGVRYGLDTTRLEAVRGVTIIPAVVAGLGQRLGSLEAGKDADILVVTGDPADPRSSVERVLVDGRVVYDAREGRRW